MGRLPLLLLAVPIVIAIGFFAPIWWRAAQRADRGVHRTGGGGEAFPDAHDDSRAEHAGEAGDGGESGGGGGGGDGGGGD